MDTGHSSQGHLRSFLEVFKSFSNIYQFVSMKGINSENFSPIPFLLSFIEILNFKKFYKICKNFLFCVWGHFEEAKVWHRNKILRERLTKPHKPKICFDIILILEALLVFEKIFFCWFWLAIWKKIHEFHVKVPL